MEITSSQADSNLTLLIETVKQVWVTHPLRSSQMDELLIRVTVDVYVGDRFGLNSDQYPMVRLSVNHHPEQDHVNMEAAIAHEFTHLIDRHDPDFIGERSIEEAASHIAEIPEGDVNESILRAFHIYWNAYIDGRLERRNIQVDTFERRLEEKVGFRKGTKYVSDEEIGTLRSVWDAESNTLEELIELAERFPSRRPPHLCVKYA